MTDPYSKKPWLKFYDEHVPPNLDYEEKTFAQLFLDNTKDLKKRVAVHYMGTSITFGELDDYSNRFAHFLKDSGLKPGDTVGVNLPNLPTYYISIIGIQKAGCVLTGVSPLLSPRELEYQLNDSGAKALVTLDIFFGNVEQVVKNTGVVAIAVVEIADFLPGVKRFLGKLLKKIPTGEVNPIPGIPVKKYMEILKDMPSDPVLEKVSIDAPCTMQYTGGTTGPPKGAVLTHRNIVFHFKQIMTWMEMGIGEETWLSALPLFHQGGLALGLGGMSTGSTQIPIPNPRDLDFIISAIKKYRPEGMVNVPTIYLELLKKPEFRSHDFSNARWFFSGGAPFPVEYIKDFEDVVGAGKLLEMLGMTETSPILISLPLYGKKKPGSVGLPYPDTEVKLVDPETGKLAPVGEPGEVVARGPQVFTIGYHNKPEETANTLRDGWIYTGDICTMDEEGYFYVVDRLKDMIIVSGFKVFARNLDNVLMEHPDVDMAATIGIPDPKRPGSEIVVSAIVLKPGVEKSDETKEKLTEYMKEKMAKYEVPKRIDFMDTLPTSVLGKVLKRELKEKYEI